VIVSTTLDSRETFITAMAAESARGLWALAVCTVSLTRCNDALFGECQMYRFCKVQQR